ncbi:1-phosphofructokinase family hexose kinase [Microbacterium sp. B19]|uniref:1-phosphofructokinase family hexose kinase n=1 Tax=Microbacterium sp. B19 TaxID=96765 RepID=UPI00034AFF0D|nr:PfkB family carbohydrate kinase [Microbacterium sp. B19]
MIVTATPNPAVDVTLSVRGLDRGGSQSVSPAHQRLGGKAVNVARVAAQQGVEATAVLLGTVPDHLHAESIPGVGLIVVPTRTGIRSTYAVAEADTGTVTMLNETGEPRLPGEWESFVDAVARARESASCLVVSGSLPPGSDLDHLRALVGDARAAGVPVIADLVGDALWAAAEAGADVIKPNRTELHRTVGYDDPEAGARALQEHGAGMVIVSLGEDGLIVVPPAAPPVHAALDRALRGNPTGAGDAAVASVAARIDRGDRLDAIGVATAAVAWSAAAVLSPVAGSLDDSLPDLVARVRVR